MLYSHKDENLVKKDQTEDKKALNEQREEFAIEIRKQKRDEILQQKRNQNTQQNTQNNTIVNENGTQIEYTEDPQQNNNGNLTHNTTGNIIVDQDQNNQNNNTYYNMTHIKIQQLKSLQNQQYIGYNFWEDYSQEHIKDYINALVESKDRDGVLKSIIMLKKGTMYESCKSYQMNLEKIIQKDVPKIFFQILLRYPNDQELIYETILLMNNFLQGTTIQTTKIADCKIVHQDFNGDGIQFLNLLMDKYVKEKNLKFLNQIMFGIGNIVGTKIAYREFYIKNNLYEQIFNIMNLFPVELEENLSLNRHLAWTLCSLTRDKPPEDYQFNMDKLAILVHSIQKNKDDEYSSDIIWSILQVLQQHVKLDSLNNNSAIIRNLLECKILPILEASLFNVNMPIILPGLRIFGVLLKGDIQLTQEIIKNTQKTMFPRIFQLMDHSMRIVRLETLKVLNVLSKKDCPEINKLISETFIQKIIFKANKDDQAITKECIKLINNLFECLHDGQFFLLVNQDLYDILNTNLTYPDTVQDADMIIYALQILYKMITFYKNSQVLQLGKRAEKIKKMIEEQGIINKVEDLQTHPSEGIYNQCQQILELFAEGEEDNYGLYSNDGMNIE